MWLSIFNCASLKEVPDEQSWTCQKGRDITTYHWKEAKSFLLKSIEWIQILINFHRNLAWNFFDFLPRTQISNRLKICWLISNINTPKHKSPPVSTCRFVPIFTFEIRSYQIPPDFSKNATGSPDFFSIGPSILIFIAITVLELMPDMDKENIQAQNGQSLSSFLTLWMYKSETGAGFMTIFSTNSETGWDS